jgi:hypothetical protein
MILYNGTCPYAVIPETEIQYLLEYSQFYIESVTLSSGFVETNVKAKASFSAFLSL